MTIKYITWWILVIISVFVIILMLPYNQSSLIREHLDRSQAGDVARDYLQQNNIDLSDYQSVVRRVVDNFTLTYLSKSLDREKLQDLLDRDVIPNNHWEVQFLKNLPRDQQQTRYTIWISPQGKILGHQRQIPDTLTLPSIIEAQALARARFFINNETNIDLNRFVMKKSQQNRRLNRTDYQFVWERDAKFADGVFRLTVNIQGDEVGGYEYEFEMPEEIQSIVRNKTTQGTLLFFVQFIVLILIFVYALILFLRKYHEGEVSVSLGRNLFLIIFTVGLVGSINEFPVTGVSVTLGTLSFRNNQLIVFLYEVLIRNTFIGILILTGWAVGEAYARRLAPEKLNSIDSVLNKRFYTLSTGKALLRGGALGFVVAAIYLVYLALVTGKNSDLAPVFYPVGDSFQHILPFYTVLKNIIITTMIGEIIFRFFIINIAYNHFRKKWIAIAFSAISWMAVVLILSNFPHVSNYYLSFAVALILGVFLAWLYFKYDLLTVIATSAASQIIFISIPLFASPNTWHQVSVYVLILLLILPVFLIIMSFIRRDEFHYKYSGLPKHILRISERERMQKELEIARNVQIGLLPKSNPQIESFDIAGICRPAKEVGGDYYDFVYLSPTKIGIAIGDVSGKGVPAAIYMTLTKGILQSHADDNISPKIVLNKVNRLLYKNIEKNSFVSMFYAILDTEKSELVFARAGHNPGIMITMQDGKDQFLSTDGIALGLEEGSIFHQTLQEQSIKIAPGDTLVFYTDGLTEAMNEKQEEFGEDLFLNTIGQYRQLTAENLIQKILEEVDKFVAGHPQHDDMTIVVLKSNVV